MVIYKQYNQQELDLQYNNRFHVPDFEKYLNRSESLSRQAEKKYKPVKDIAYGDLSRECLDIFPSPNPGSKTLVFIHGGYWQKLDKSSFHFIAGSFADYGITTVLINYPLAPGVTMDQIVMSCRNAVNWVHKNIAQWNGDPDQIYIAGHSAGAHLATMIITGEEKQSKQNYIKGICAISGLYNLIPIQLSNINDAIQMDKEMAIRNSPVFMNPTELCPLLLTVGGDETAEFKDQSSELSNKWKSKMQSVELKIIPGLNHFSIIDSVYETDAALHQLICKLMSI
jgi:arylformamidase